MASSFTRFLHHTQRRTTVGRTPPDDWSARNRALYLTTHNNHNTQTSMPPSGIRTRDISKPAAADRRLRPLGYWDRLGCLIREIKFISKFVKESISRNLAGVGIFFLFHLRFTVTCCLQPVFDDVNFCWRSRNIRSCTYMHHPLLLRTKLAVHRVITRSGLDGQAKRKIAAPVRNQTGAASSVVQSLSWVRLQVMTVLMIKINM